MKKSIKISKKPSTKKFVLLVLTLLIGLFYLLNDTVTKTNHVDVVIETIYKPTQGIRYISQSVKKDIQSVKHINKETICLAKNIFFEGRNTDVYEKIRIVNVTLNRVKSGKYPDSICEVVYQDSQFSWTLYNKNLKSIVNSSNIEAKAWQESLMIAEYALDDRIPDITNGSLFYHTHKVKPTWSKHKKKTVNSKWHRYYK